MRKFRVSREERYKSKDRARALTDITTITIKIFDFKLGVWNKFLYLQ